MTAAERADEAKTYDPRAVQDKWQVRWADMDPFRASDDPDINDVLYIGYFGVGAWATSADEAAPRWYCFGGGREGAPGGC